MSPAPRQFVDFEPFFGQPGADFFMDGIVTVDSWGGWCDSVFWADGGPKGAVDFRAGGVVFCKIDEVMRFFERVRLTRRRVVLVTGQGDFPCDGWRQGFLPANVAHWFATNVTQPHPRITALPLGLGSPSSPTTLTLEAILDARRDARPRDKWLYVNFRSDTNPTVRGPVFDFFRSLGADWVTFDPPGERGSNGRFLGQILRHRFVLCPPGNGVDTHRMWEALVAGAVPVVLESQAMEPFRDPPILFVKDYGDLTHELLEREWMRFQPLDNLPEALFADFWGGKVREAKQRLAGRETMPLAKWFVESAKYGFGMVGRKLGW